MKRRTAKIVAAITAAVVFLTTAVFFGFYFTYRPHKDYDNAIKAWSYTFGVDEVLVYSVIKTESNFRAYVESRVGARGLMQIMPETGAWIAGKLYKQNHTDDKLFEPEYNIELGVWYLSYLLNKFEDTDTALIAYNAGEGNAKKWRDENIEPPFRETREYVKKVNGHYKYYKIFL